MPLLVITSHESVDPVMTICEGVDTSPDDTRDPVSTRDHERISPDPISDHESVDPESTTHERVSDHERVVSVTTQDDIDHDHASGGEDGGGAITVTRAPLSYSTSYPSITWCS
jgi:hypothetical protein